MAKSIPVLKDIIAMKLWVQLLVVSVNKNMTFVYMN